MYSVQFLPRSHPYGREDRFRPLTDPRSYYGLFCNFSQFLSYFCTLFMFRWSLSGSSHTSSSLVGGHTLEVGSISITSEITFRIKVGNCDLATGAGSAARKLFFFGWTVAMCLISYEVPLSSLLFTGFDRDWSWCLHSFPPSVLSPLGCVVCGMLPACHMLQMALWLGMLIISHLEGRNFISPCNFHTIIIYVRVWI